MCIDFCSINVLFHEAIVSAITFSSVLYFLYAGESRWSMWNVSSYLRLRKFRPKLEILEGDSAEINFYGSIQFWNFLIDITLESYPQKPALLMNLCCAERQWAGIYSWHIWVESSVLLFFSGGKYHVSLKVYFLKHQFFWRVLVGLEQSSCCYSTFAEKRVYKIQDTVA